MANKLTISEVVNACQEHTMKPAKVVVFGDKPQGSNEVLMLVEKLSLDGNTRHFIGGAMHQSIGTGNVDENASRDGLVLLMYLAHRKVGLSRNPLIIDSHGHHNLETLKGLTSLAITTCISHNYILPLNIISMKRATYGQVVQKILGMSKIV